jgi:hypothetical protein
MIRSASAASCGTSGYESPRLREASGTPTTSMTCPTVNLASGGRSSERQPEGTRGGLEGSSRGRAARLRFRNRLMRLASVLYKSRPAIVALRDGQHVLVRENAELGTDSSFSERMTETRSCDVCAARRRSDWAVGRAEPAPGDTLDHIAGLSVAHDITICDQQHRIQHWLRARRGMPAPGRREACGVNPLRVEG